MIFAQYGLSFHLLPLLILWKYCDGICVLHMRCGVILSCTAFLFVSAGRLIYPAGRADALPGAGPAKTDQDERSAKAAHAEEQTRYERHV